MLNRTSDLACLNKPSLGSQYGKFLNPINASYQSVLNQELILSATALPFKLKSNGVPAYQPRGNRNSSNTLRFVNSLIAVLIDGEVVKSVATSSHTKVRAFA